jgi:hypothetical protein
MRQIGKALASALKQPKAEEESEVGSAVASAIPQNETPVTTLPKTGELRIPSRDMPSLPPGFIGKDGRIVERPVRPPIGINPPRFYPWLEGVRKGIETIPSQPPSNSNPPNLNVGSAVGNVIEPALPSEPKRDYIDPSLISRRGINPPRRLPFPFRRIRKFLGEK